MEKKYNSNEYNNAVFNRNTIISTISSQTPTLTVACLKIYGMKRFTRALCIAAMNTITIIRPKIRIMS